MTIVSLIVCVSLVLCSVSAFAAANDTANIISAITGQGGSVNLSQYFSDWLKNEIDNQDESIIDKFVTNIKNQWNGVEPDDSQDNTQDVSVSFSEGEKENIAELFNITVNELKKGQPAFTKTVTATMDQKAASSLQGGLGPVTGLVESLIGTKDIFAGVIDGVNQDSQVRTRYPAGNDVKNNIPVSGKDYTACLTADDIKDYTVTIYRSGAYTMHIDLLDVEGSAADSGLSHVFDTTDKAYATIELGTTSLNLSVMLKYVNNYVECEVNRDGQITSYTMGMGITFLFQQDDGSYSTVIPYMGIDAEEEGIIYEVTTEFSGIDFSLRQLGDANNDGKINSSDARFVLRIASSLDECADADFNYCDVTLDKKVTAADAREILRASAGLTKLKTSQEAFGFTEYEKDEATQRHIDDLLVLIMAYQTAKDEEEQRQLQAAYESKYNTDNTAEEETTQKITTTGDKVNEVINGIGTIIGELIN